MFLSPGCNLKTPRELLKKITKPNTAVNNWSKSTVAKSENWYLSNNHPLLPNVGNRREVFATWLWMLIWRQIFFLCSVDLHLSFLSLTSAILPVPWQLLRYSSCTLEQVLLISPWLIFESSYLLVLSCLGHLTGIIEDMLLVLSWFDTCCFYRKQGLWM